jgi:dihydropyrimidinase
MAYKGALMVDDEELLAGLARCAALRALPQVHAENGDAVAEGQRRVFDAGVTGPEGHALSRPAVLEAEATGRAIRLASFVNVPLYVVHVMSAGAADEVRR